MSREIPRITVGVEALEGWKVGKNFGKVGKVGNFVWGKNLFLLET